MPIRIIRASDRRAIDRIVDIDRSRMGEVERRAIRIVSDVRARGDRALKFWRRRLDGDASPLWVTPRELRQGWSDTSPTLRAAIRFAIRHVRIVAERQRPRGFSVVLRPGVRIDQHVQPLARVGCYVPGGRHPLPSSVIMTVVPAVAAGVPEIIVACPRPEAAVLCAALEAGATRVLRAGGAQVIAAMAYGTRSVPRVDKIAGPGNAWVAAAKATVSRDVAIDFHAGPSEIVILSRTSPAQWIAADLVAQAEHDPHARAIFVTWRSDLAVAVREHLTRMAPVGSVASRALRSSGAIVVAASRRKAIDVVNAIAPEHLVCDNATDAAACTAAGTVFVGRWSAQAAGDYCTGSNHVLPTGGAARFRGGLATADFVRSFTVQTLSRRGLASVAVSAIALAHAEGLIHHAASIRLRV